MAGKIHIGTSGWSYKHWKGAYYPEKLASRHWLSHYAKDFAAAEINASFYKLPSEETVLKWMKEVPKNFFFCPKMSRFLTHMKKLNHPEEPLERFFKIFSPMKKMLGPVLIQLPVALQFKPAVVEHFYKILHSDYRSYDFVMEVRHESWFSKESLEMMKQFGIGLVMSHSENAFPYAEVITAQNIYLRFHGPRQLYASAYPDPLLNQYAKKLRSWKTRGHGIWAFFNNDIHCYAPADAKKLLELVQ